MIKETKAKILKLESKVYVNDFQSEKHETKIREEISKLKNLILKLESIQQDIRILKYLIK